MPVHKTGTAFTKPVDPLVGQAIEALLSIAITDILSDGEHRPSRSSTLTSRRMNIEQRLAEAIQSFSLDALAGAVPLNIGLDVVLSVLARTLGAALRRRLSGYNTATPSTLQRQFLPTGGNIQPPRPDQRLDQPAPTRPPPSHRARNDHRPLAGRPIRLKTKSGVNDSGVATVVTESVWVVSNCDSS